MRIPGLCRVLGVTCSVLVAAAACYSPVVATAAQGLAVPLGYAGCADPAYPAPVDTGVTGLTVCATRTTDLRYSVENGTQDLWLVRPAASGLFLDSAAPAGAVSERIKVFRSARGIDQMGSRALPLRWVVEPGTAAFVDPGRSGAELVIDPQLQSAWTTFVLVDQVAQKAGSTLPALLVRNKPLQKATTSCTGLALGLYGTTPETPKTVDALIEKLGLGTKATRCAEDLAAADRAFATETGRSGVFNPSALESELRQSASQFDDFLKVAGKLAQLRPR